MASKSKTLNDLFLHTLKDVYYAERHIGKSLSKFRKAATSGSLRQILEDQREASDARVERLERVFELLDKKVHGLPCEAIQGIISEAKDVSDEFADSPALDAGLVAAGQAMEHYAIARYGALRTWAAQLGLNEAATLLEQTLAEHRDVDLRLSTLADALHGPAMDAGDRDQHSGDHVSSA